MSAFVGYDSAFNSSANERKVAYEINDLVPDTLIWKSEAVFDWAIRVDN